MEIEPGSGYQDLGNLRIGGIARYQGIERMQQRKSAISQGRFNVPVKRLQGAILVKPIKAEK
jgi:hypothetical protein